MTTSVQSEVAAAAAEPPHATAEAAGHPLAWSVGVVGAFAVLVIALAVAYGMPFTPPTERVSLATGFHSLLPVAAGSIAYLLARLLHSALRGRQWDGRQVGKVIALDFGLMALFVLACYLHFNLKMWVPLINPARFDDVYMRTDEAVRGLVDTAMWLRVAIGGSSPAVDQAYQGAFLGAFVLSFVYYAVLDRRYYYRYIFATITVLCVGAASYLVAPAVGPFIYEAGANAKATEAQGGMWRAYNLLLEGGVPWLKQYGSDYFTGALAAMPSLHVAHALVAMFYMVRARSILAPLFVLLFGWMLIESVASRWHYVIDLPVGLLIAAGVLWFTARVVPVARSANR